MQRTRRIDGKYHVGLDENGSPVIVNTATQEVLPEDEPLMLFQAKDKFALRLVRFYKDLCHAGGCKRSHLDAVEPSTILFWITERVRLGKNKVNDAQIVEAFECAKAMGDPK